jgi:hypothetical protein
MSPSERVKYILSEATSEWQIGYRNIILRTVKISSFTICCLNGVAAFSPRSGERFQCPGIRIARPSAHRRETVRMIYGCDISHDRLEVPS